MSHKEATAVAAHLEPLSLVPGRVLQESTQDLASCLLYRRWPAPEEFISPELPRRPDCGDDLPEAAGDQQRQ